MCTHNAFLNAPPDQERTARREGRLENGQWLSLRVLTEPDATVLGFVWAPRREDFFWGRPRGTKLFTASVGAARCLRSTLPSSYRIAARRIVARPARRRTSCVPLAGPQKKSVSEPVSRAHSLSSRYLQPSLVLRAPDWAARAMAPTPFPQTAKAYVGARRDWWTLFTGHAEGDGHLRLQSSS